MPFLRLKGRINISSFAASLGFSFFSNPSPRPRMMEGDAEIMQTGDLIHPGNDDVSYCQHTMGNTAGQGKGDRAKKTKKICAPGAMNRPFHSQLPVSEYPEEWQLEPSCTSHGI